MSDTLFIGVLLGVFMFVGSVFGFNFALSSVKSNELQGYHCAPIQKVKTLEEAKAIIEAHQKRIGSK